MVYTCIVCPKSCRVSVTEVNGELEVSGNICPRGKKHALTEHECPMRMITTTVKIENANMVRLPVISSSEIPKSQLEECLEKIYSTEISAPVKEGETLIGNINNLGVDIIASRSIKSCKIENEIGE